MVFKPGASGNPLGRTKEQAKKAKHIAELLLPLEPIARQIYQDLLQCDDLELRLKAADRVLDRIYGKASQAVDLEASGNITVVIKDK